MTLPAPAELPVAPAGLPSPEPELSALPASPPESAEPAELPAAGASAPLPPQPGQAAPIPFASEDLRRMADWVLARRDHQGHPFVVVDKQNATLMAFHGDGQPAGSTPVILGRTAGDIIVPGVGQRTQSAQLRAEDLTTPSGRFESTPGRNRQGEAVVWIDYSAALAIHRLRPGASQAQRLRSLATTTPADNRGSAGCVVVPVAFYTQIVQPLLGAEAGVVYILPEQGLGPDAQWVAQGLPRRGERSAAIQQASLR